MLAATAFRGVARTVTATSGRLTVRPLPSGGTDLVAAGNAPAFLGSCRGVHKAPGVPWKIYHPHIQKPERMLEPEGCLTGPARYIPKGLRHAKYIESIRTGEYLGPDWPYNFLPGTFWRQRRYNAQYHPIPADVSTTSGVQYYTRLNVWNVMWYEGEQQRFRFFRAQYGFTRAKRSAEEFRAKLVAAGRVDGARSERSARVLAIAGEAGRLLKMKKLFIRANFKDARRRGNSGTKLGPEKKTREDYKKRGLLL